MQKVYLKFRNPACNRLIVEAYDLETREAIGCQSSMHLKYEAFNWQFPKVKVLEFLSRLVYEWDCIPCNESGEVLCIPSGDTVEALDPFYGYAVDWNRAALPR